jgi:hypothetical protein
MKLKIEKNLCMFLEKNNALDKFVNNLLNSTCIQIEAMFGWEYSHPIEKIIDQFIWGNTPEKYNYWNELNTLFEKQKEQKQSVLKTDQFILSKN